MRLRVALAALVVFGLVGLLIWECGHYLAVMQSKRARVEAINSRFRELRTEMYTEIEKRRKGQPVIVSTIRVERQRVRAERNRLSLESQELRAELRTLSQRFLDLFR
jgi:DNA anti-recombination protein RmuC